jgi:hypothetical protein
MSDEATWWVKPLDDGTVELGLSHSDRGVKSALSPDCAALLASALTEAIEEAKRQADPFEKWWESLCPQNMISYAPGFYRHLPGGSATSKDRAKITWDAATKAAQ